jgi:hypothetical protein
MKKVLDILKIIRNIILGIVFTLYLLIIILVSTLILNRNDYGVTQFNDKTLIIIDKENANDKYKQGQLVIVKSKKLSELKVGEDVFIYKVDTQNSTVSIINSTIKDITKEDSNSYLTLEDDTSWAEEYIVGTKTKVYDKYGSYLSFTQSKWIFFFIFIVPCFFILLYEVYSIIIVIKFGDNDNDIVNIPLGNNEENSVEDKKIKELMAEINTLKEQMNDNNEEEKTNINNQEYTSIDINNKELHDNKEVLNNELEVTSNEVDTKNLEENNINSFPSINLNDNQENNTENNSNDDIELL